MSGAALRPYQAAAIAAVEAALAEGVRRQVITLPTGAGKTVTAVALARRRGGRVLWLAHRDELLTQAAETFARLWPEAAVGRVQTGEDGWEAPVVVASVPTLIAGGGRRLRRWAPDAFDTVIVDECFPAGVQVDGRPIASLRPGETVRAWDPCRRAWRTARIIRVLQRPAPSRLVQILVGGRSVTCTPNHPFWTPTGWKPAECLAPGDWVGVVEETRREWHDASAVPPMRKSQMGSASRHPMPGMLGRAAQPSCRSVYRMRPRDDHHHSPSEDHLSKDGAGLLLGGVPARLASAVEFRGHESDQPPLCSRPDAAEEPDASGRNPREDVPEFATTWASPPRPGGQRATASSTPGAPRRGTGMAHGMDCSHGGAAGAGLSNALQTRHCPPRVAHRDRSGWGGASGQASSGSGPTQGTVVGWAWVDRVAVLEPGRDGVFERVCPDGLVYNLEVEDPHTYCANGFIVHNCHHALSAGHRALLDHLQPDLLLGLTATPFRGDKLSLAQVFDRVVYAYGIQDAIRDGWLVDIRAYRVTGPADLDAVGTTAGDFAEGALARAVNTPERNRLVVDAYRQYAPGRKALVFAADVQHALDLAQAFRAAGIAAEAAHGGLPMAERRRLRAAFREGAAPVVANAMLWTEGFDEPSIGAVVLARPTQSLVLYSQMVGRGLRPHPGKPDCVLIDVADNTRRHRLVSVADLFGLRRLPRAGETVGERLAAEARVSAEAEAWLARVAGGRVRAEAVADLFETIADGGAPVIDWRDVAADAAEVLASPWLARPRYARRMTVPDGPATEAQAARLASFGWPEAEARRLPKWLASWALDRHREALEARAEARVRAWAGLLGLTPEEVRQAVRQELWQLAPATERQHWALRRHRTPDGVLAALSRGEAAMLLDLARGRPVGRFSGRPALDPPSHPKEA